MSPLAVPRSRLTALIDLAVQQRLTIVVSPPGYGKTVALAQWAAAHPKPRVRWLALGPEHNDAAVFSRDLRAAIDLDDALPTTLVFDDFQLLSNGAILDDLVAFLDEAPRSLHTVIATRVDPPTPYFRLRLSDALVELRQEDLAFTTTEAGELIERLSGRALRRDLVDALVERTEGWAAGLQLAALSLRDRDDVEEFVGAFAGDDRHVADFLAEQVLNKQPDEIRRFLLTTSVLDRMSGPLCDHLTGRRGGQAMLEELDRTSMFLTRLDVRRMWFRYHPLFRTLLRQHLHDEDPALERELLHRAAEWHLARDDLDTGVWYLIEARSWDHVVHRARVHGREMLARGRALAVAEWIEKVPEVERRDDVGVRMIEAASLLIGGDLGRAGAVLDAIEGSDAATPGEGAAASLLRALWALYEGVLGNAVVAADRAVREVAAVQSADLPEVLGLMSTPDDLRQAALVIRGTALAYRGSLEEARASLRGAGDGGHPMWHVAGLGALALVEAWSGRLIIAEQLAARTVAIALKVAVDREPLATDARLAAVIAARDRGDLDKADALLEELAAAASSDTRRLVPFAVGTESALLALAHGDAEEGLTALAATRSGRASVTRAMVSRARAAEAELLIVSGDFAGARRALDGAPLTTSEVVAARVALAVETGDLREARELIDGWPDQPQPRAGLERRLWFAIIDHLDGAEARAASGFADVVGAAEAEHFVRLFRSRDALALARPLYRAAPSPFLHAIVSQTPGPVPIRTTRGLVEQLTEREFKVLVLLPTRLSNAEIAEALGVSLNTIKTHLKHIYRKLGVIGRSEAVATAERVHLL